MNAAALFLLIAALLEFSGFFLLRVQGLSFWGMLVPFLVFNIGSFLIVLALVIAGDSWEARKRR